MTDAPVTAPGEGSSAPRRLIAVVAVVAMAVAAGAWWLVGGTESASPSTTSRPTSSTPAMPTTPATDPMITDGAAADDASTTPDRARPTEPPIVATGLWPDPPLDHDPHVLGRPGNGPLVADAEGLSLLYVNSIGRPTLIDLATGDREELDIATTRLSDRFEIEAGHVVAVSKGDRLRLGPGAITVRVHRPQLFDLSFPAAPSTGIDLCLADVCPQLESATATGEGDRVGLLDPDDYPELARLLEGGSGPGARFTSVAFGDTTTQIPARGPGPVWMIREA